MHALNEIIPSANVKSNYSTTIHFLNYAACNPNADIVCCASVMILQTKQCSIFSKSPSPNIMAKGQHLQAPVHKDSRIISFPRNIVPRNRLLSKTKRENLFFRNTPFPPLQNSTSPGGAHNQIYYCYRLC